MLRPKLRTVKEHELALSRLERRLLFLKYQMLLGRLAQLTQNIAAAARFANESYYKVRYSLKKVTDPTFHPGTHGGLRYNGFQFIIS
jgi:hypothetical protein